MNKKEFKNAMSGVQPSEQTIERIMDMAQQKSKKRVRLAPLATAVVCLAVLVAGIFGGNAITARMNVTKPNDTTNRVLNQAVNNVFNIVAYADENDEKKQIVLSDDNIVLQDCKLTKSYDSNGQLEIRGSGNSSFSVYGENIKSVKYSCETGGICFVVDINKVHYLQEQGKYYDVVLPILDEYKNIKTSQLFDVFEEHFKKGEYDKYFTDVKKKSIDDYYNVVWVYDDDIVDENGDSKIVGIGVVSNDTWNEVKGGHDGMKSYTFENYFNTTEPFSDFYWECNQTDIDEILRNPEMGFDEISHDTLTIDVTFNDGSVQSVSYDLGFNSNGNITIQKL